MTTLRFALLALALAAPARALEVSIEENRAERGSIGYVDLRRIFQRFPETQKAKQSFSEIVRQAEDQVNLRKAEVLAVRAEVSKLEAELELLKRTPIPVPEPLPPAPKEAPSSEGGLSPLPQRASAAAESPAQAAVAAASATAAALASSHVQPAQSAVPAAASTGTLAEAAAPAAAKPLILNLPGLTTAPVVIEPPAGESPTQALQLSTPAAAAAPPTAPAPPSAAEEEEARRQARARAEAAQLAVAAAQAREGRLRELRESIDLKRKELAAKEEDFKKRQEVVEKNLLELEGRRSEILLGKIYAVIQEVAHENGVGVVVDKGQILFGQHSVDLTDKVIKKLEGL
ncbi:MAG: OmpH family outer membrane protein [Elusimicrobia bacterium]|nr:OmpH family outer membrane protein [Elusimicrobiota bacterium]